MNYYLATYKIIVFAQIFLSNFQNNYEDKSLRICVSCKFDCINFEITVRNGYIFTNQTN